MKRLWPNIVGLVSLILFWLWTPLGWLGALATAWCAYFFRDPQRVTPVREGLIVSPADGRVSLIANAVPPPELGLSDKPLPRVSVFMSVFDCHVNRTPVTGRIEKIVYRAGKFLNADLDKASEDNERNAFLISTASARIGVVQIAGLIARRIVPFVKEGQTVSAGERIGMIRLPETCANISFGGTKRNRLFMTGSTSLYAVYVETQGAHIS